MHHLFIPSQAWFSSSPREDDAYRDRNHPVWIPESGIIIIIIYSDVEIVIQIQCNFTLISQQHIILKVVMKNFLNQSNQFLNQFNQFLNGIRKTI